MVTNPPANARERGSIPGAGRSYMPRINKAPCAATAEHSSCKGQLLKPGRLEPVLERPKSIAESHSPRVPSLATPCGQIAWAGYFTFSLPLSPSIQ